MLFKKYKFPVHIFIILEKSTPIVYTSETITSNHYICLVQPAWFYLINVILKKEINNFFSSLIEISAIDTLKYSAMFEFNNFIINDIKHRLLIFNSYYLYLLKNRITLFNPYGINSNVPSIDKIYFNANWAERELSELFFILYSNKKDTRALLLDYPKKNYPMLKDFPTESWSELYYDFLEKTLFYTEVIDHTEL